MPPLATSAAALNSCPRFSISACFLRLATRESAFSTLAAGVGGGGPTAVIDVTVANRGGIVCREH
jgi:hypothetical protein